MFLAALLTLGRIAISPLFFILYLYYPSLGISLTYLPYVLLLLLFVSEMTDLFDGYVARRSNQVTDLGKVLDPMADSIFRLTVFFTFSQGIIQLPLWLVFLFFYRDSVISLLRTICALRGFALAARRSGKIKAVLQGTAAFMILLLMIPYSRGYLSIEELRSYSFYIVLVTAVYTLFSGVEYIIANREFILKASRPPGVRKRRAKIHKASDT